MVVALLGNKNRGGWESFSILLRLQDTNDAADLLLLCAGQYFDSVFWKIILEYFFSDIKTSGFIICLVLGSTSSYPDTNEVHEDETYYTPQLDYKRKYMLQLYNMTKSEMLQLL